MPSLLPPSSAFGRDISRPSSTSTTNSSSYLFNQPQFHNRSASLGIGRETHHQSRTSLPALSSLTGSLAATPPSIRSFSANHAHMSFQGSMPPIPTPGIAGNAPPVCQNCQTSTTPLWRRDEAGSVLCNACGLFLKLHGRPRPISLKTDIIKSRNRVKSSTQGLRKKFENGLPASQSEMMTPQNHRRVSQMAMSATSDRSHSPISRTGTPGLHDPNIAPQHIFDGVALHDQPYGGSPSLPPLHLNHPSPGSLGPLPERQLDTSSSYDQLLAVNTTLRTRVSELEVINMVYSDNENGLRTERDNAVRERDGLKRRVEELEKQLREVTNIDQPNKRPRRSLSPRPEQH